MELAVATAAPKVDVAAPSLPAAWIRHEVEPVEIKLTPLNFSEVGSLVEARAGRHHPQPRAGMEGCNAVLFALPRDPLDRRPSTPPGACRVLLPGS